MLFYQLLMSKSDNVRKSMTNLNNTTLKAYRSTIKLQSNKEYIFFTCKDGILTKLLDHLKKPQHILKK